jgi:glycosyltransferase domain-containing protein
LGTVAVIIPSKNRINYCVAQIRYYKRFNYGGVLVIVDSSSKSNYIKLEKEAKELNYPNLRLFHDSTLSTHEAIEFGLRQVKNECVYYVFSGDDDFFVVNGIYKAAHFLDRNPDFMGVVGKAITTKHISLDNRIRVGWVRTYWNPKDIADDNALNRVRQISRRYINLEFAVKRQSAFIDHQTQLNKVFGKVEFKDSTDLEICTTLSIALTGKIKYLRTKFLVRGDHDARPNLLPKPATTLSSVRKKNFILYLDSVAEDIDKSLSKHSDYIVDYYFNTVNKKKAMETGLIVKLLYLFVRVFKKFNGLFLKLRYREYFKSFIES